MTNSVKGEVDLKLSDGREYRLVLDMEALLSVEDATGRPLPEVMARAGAGFFKDTASIAQAAFVRFHPEVTREQVLEMLVSDRDSLTEALGEATSKAFPDPDKSTEGKAGAPRPRATKSSGRNGAKRA